MAERSHRLQNSPTGRVRTPYHIKIIKYVHDQNKELANQIEQLNKQTEQLTGHYVNQNKQLIEKVEQLGEQNKQLNEQLKQLNDKYVRTRNIMIDQQGQITRLRAKLHPPEEAAAA